MLPRLMRGTAPRKPTATNRRLSRGPTNPHEVCSSHFCDITARCGYVRLRGQSRRAAEIVGGPILTLTDMKCLGFSQRTLPQARPFRCTRFPALMT